MGVETVDGWARPLCRRRRIQYAFISSSLSCALSTAWSATPPAQFTRPEIEQVTFVMW